MKDPNRNDYIFNLGLEQVREIAFQTEDLIGMEAMIESKKNKVAVDVESISSQVAKAREHKKITGTTPDPEWYRRVKSALRYKRRELSKLETMHRMVHDIRIDREQKRFEKRFFDTAKDLLPEEIFASLCETAKQTTF
jgi:hypothetical protein